LRESDIWIVTFPKCGTTWTQELVWTLVNDVDTEKGKVPLFVRSPWIEAVFPMKDGQLAIDYLNSMKDRRIIKTHLPLEFLPDGVLEKCKVVYVARNPKDAAVSYYYHSKNIGLHGFTGTVEELIDLFMEDLVFYGPYWNHITGAWNKKTERNLKFLWYEDMKADQMKVIEELCEFLQKPLTEEQKTKLFETVQFDNMKANPFSSPAPTDVLDQSIFFRKGLVGDWENHFDKQRSEKWEAWIENNITGTGMEKLPLFQ